MGVLGNHDYGGVCYLKGWDQQIYYTWKDKGWVMPGQHWRRTIQYKNFNVDMFFVDGNVFDSSPAVGASHNMCNIGSSPGPHCEAYVGGYWPPAPGQPGGSCLANGPKQNGPACSAWFMDVWDQSYKFLMAEVPKSTADWQFVINHYPAQYNVGIGGKNYMDWSKWLAPAGVDLYIAGHTHEQHIYYHSPGPLNMGATPWVVTGGGGGVTSEIIPVTNGHDDAYGFMDMEISLHNIVITAYTHGGLQGELIIRNKTTTTPVIKKSYEELVMMPPAGIVI